MSAFDRTLAAVLGVLCLVLGFAGGVTVRDHSEHVMPLASVCADQGVMVDRAVTVATVALTSADACATTLRECTGKLHECNGLLREVAKVR